MFRVILSVDREGARKEAVGMGERPSMLIHYDNFLRKPDTTRTQGKMGMVTYLGGVHRLRPGTCIIWMEIAFIITRIRNNVVVSFGTLKAQSLMLTEVRDCDLLIVVTSSTFLKRKDILKEKRQLAQIIKACSPGYI